MTRQKALFAVGLIGACLGASQAPAAAFPVAAMAHYLDTQAGSARALGAGLALVSVPQGITDLKLNPAGIATLSGSQFTAQHHAWSQGFFQDSLTLAWPGGEKGNFGIYAQNTDFGGYGATAREATLAWASQVGANVWGGMTAGAMERSANGESDLAYLASIGTLWTPAYAWSSGFSVQYPGSNPQASNDLVWRGGISYHIQNWLHPATAALSMLFADGSGRLQFGLEDRIAAVWFFRAGYQLDLKDQGYEGLHGVSGGIGYRAGDYDIDYGLMLFGVQGASHRVNLTWNFVQN